MARKQTWMAVEALVCCPVSYSLSLFLSILVVRLSELVSVSVVCWQYRSRKLPNMAGGSRVRKSTGRLIDIPLLSPDGIGQSVRGGGQVSEVRRAGKQMEQSKARCDW